MRELTQHEVTLVAGGAEIFRVIAQAALAGAAKGVSPTPVTLEIVDVQVTTYRP
jgi:hypothetical protein